MDEEIVTDVDESEKDNSQEPELECSSAWSTHNSDPSDQEESVGRFLQVFVKEETPVRMCTNANSEFIELYRQNVCLWDTNSPLYSNRNARKTAQEQLLNVLLKYDSSANIATVRRKIDSLRSVYFRELKKVQKSEARTGTGADDGVYVPTWAHYYELNFLCEVQHSARAGTDSVPTLAPSQYTHQQQTATTNESENDGEEMADCEENTETVDVDLQPPPPKMSNKGRMSAQRHPLIAAPRNIARNITAVAPADNLESFCLSVLGDLRAVGNFHQQAIAQKLRNRLKNVQ
ncbi:uncharacterized protein LOC111062242 isoform X3 [Nilaparvata lugens]|uniref:uncharacterized protein LOC111062242 isoform X3 n=1 Tax=Nilaparvata lugens TaxID=108931 RepID=UPI00193DDCCB|nr:uncharacterized protein LOC111062242 isoform X3 [Nilaparvata lugens]